MTPIKMVIDRPHKGAIRSATFSKSPSGKYWVSLLCETGELIPDKKTINAETCVGVDLGIKSFIVTSDGISVDNPKYLRESLKKLGKLQRRKSRKIKGSQNSKKLQKRIAATHEKIAFQRTDFLHKLSRELVNNHATLAFETLRVKNMVKNPKLSLSISDAGWSTFLEMCKYKAAWAGVNILQIGTFVPSSKMCSGCFAINDLLTLDVRDWSCANCGAYHDRDINAAINIRNIAIKNSGQGLPVEPVGAAGISRGVESGSSA